MPRQRAMKLVLVTRVLAGLAASLIGLGCSKSEPPPSETKAAAAPVAVAAPEQAAASGPVKVIADENGFTPSKVTFERGKAGSITFLRTSDQTCADKVVFPELSIKKDLPLNQPVTVELPTVEAKSYTFQCGMGMYKSSVVVR
jgi:hypothetical protein